MSGAGIALLLLGSTLAETDPELTDERLHNAMTLLRERFQPAREAGPLAEIDSTTTKAQ